MVRVKTVWETTDGRTHQTSLAAQRHQLLLLLTPLADSEAIARKMVDSITRDVSVQLCETLQDLEAAWPE